jgi:hypothetical protein
LNCIVQAGDSRINRGGVIYTRPVKIKENIIKQRIISGREFAVRINIILSKSGKGQVKIDNQRGMVIIGL